MEAILAADFDVIILLGPETEATAKVLNDNKIEYFHTLNKSAAQAHLNACIKSRDLVYLKGSRGMALETFIQAYKDQN